MILPTAGGVESTSGLYCVAQLLGSGHWLSRRSLLPLFGRLFLRLFGAHFFVGPVKEPLQKPAAVIV